MASIRKRGDKYQAQVRLSGQKPQTQTFTSFNLAQAWARKIEGNPSSSVFNFNIPTLEDMIKTYEDHYTGKNHSVPTHLKFWKKELGQHPLHEIDPFMINRVTAVLAIGRVPKTVGHYMSTLSGVFNFFIKGEYIQAENKEEHELSVQAHQDMLVQLHKTGFSNPVTDDMTTKYSSSRKMETFLTLEQQKLLLIACRKNHWDRLYLLVLMALTTGARKGELLGLKWSEIDFTERTAFLPITKNGKARYLPLTASVIDEMKKFREIGSGLVFPAIYQMDEVGNKDKSDTPVTRPFDPKKAWLKSLEDSGIGQIRFHDLRHTCASNLVRAGRSLFEVGTLLGHSSTQMTARYSHLAIKDTQDMVDDVMGGLS